MIQYKRSYEKTYNMEVSIYKQLIIILKKKNKEEKRRKKICLIIY